MIELERDKANVFI